MKNEITPISRNIHSKYSFLPLDIKLDNFGTLSNLTECPVYLAELKYIAVHFPICLTKGENNTYNIKCLMGIIGNQNVYIDNKGSWTGLYLPLSLRCLPFLIGETEEEPIKKVICFKSGLDLDLDLDLISNSLEPGYIPFFDKSGHISKELNEIMRLLESIVQNNVKTKLALKSLQEEDMLVEWPIKMKFKDGEKSIDGLFKINEKKLYKLSKDQLNRLYQSGALQIAYLQILSIENLKKIVDGHLKLVKNSDATLNLREATLKKERVNKKKELDDLVKNLIDSD